MAKKQTRKSISISGDAYWKLKAFAESNNTSMSGIVEKLIKDDLDRKEGVGGVREF